MKTELDRWRLEFKFAWMHEWNVWEWTDDANPYGTWKGKWVSEGTFLTCVNIAKRIANDDFAPLRLRHLPTGHIIPFELL